MLARDTYCRSRHNAGRIYGIDVDQQSIRSGIYTRVWNYLAAGELLQSIEQDLHIAINITFLTASTK